MDMNSDKSISLSQCCVVLFALLLAALDIGGYWFVGFLSACAEWSGRAVC